MLHRSLILLLLVAAALAGCKPENKFQPPPPPEISVAKPLQKEVQPFEVLTGNTVAFNTVDLVARVEGFLTSINYTDGGFVKKGDTLFVIEQTMYQAKVKEAQEKAKAVTVAVDVDDLEASETPESILLGAVSGDQSKDRTDRALVTPWLKFLWESYRTSLETLKNNARVEPIYQVCF